MRVLFASVPAVGHLFPLVPFAWAFRAVGHEVLVASAEHTGRAADCGLQVVDVAPGYSALAVLQQLPQDHPELLESFGNQTLPVDPTPWAPVFAAINRPLVDRTMDLVDDWRPDLVVYEQVATYGLLAAARAGVPAIQRNLGVYTSGRMHQETAGHLADVCARYGISDLPTPAGVLEFMPPSMLPREPEGWFTRYVPPGGGLLGDRLPERPDRPRIVVTMGTNAPRFYGLGTVAKVIAAASTVDAEFVVALGDVDPAPLGELPSNVRTVGWMPLAALLRTAVGVVHHGGGGTAMAAIDAGIPQLIVLDPMDGTQQTTGDAVRERGIGLTTTPDEIDATLLKQLLTDDAMRRASAEVRDEMAALPSPAQLVPRLAALAS